MRTAAYPGRATPRERTMDPAAAPRPPCRHLFTKTGGRAVYFEEDPLVFRLRPAILRRNNAFLLSTVARYLNCPRPLLGELFRVARRTLMEAVPVQQRHIQALKREQRHMKGEDAAAFQTACVLPLEDQIVDEIGTMADFSALAQLAARGTESLVSRADFYGHVLPCAKRMWPGPLYGQWIDHLLEYGKAGPETTLV